MTSKGRIFENSSLFVGFKKVVTAFILVLAGTGFLQQGYGQETSKSDGLESQEKKPVVFIPKISDIIPLAAKIEAKLALTEKSQKDTANQKALKTQFAAVEKNIDSLTSEITDMESSDHVSVRALNEFKKRYLKVISTFKEANVPLSDAIKSIEDDRKGWLKEQESWLIWEDTLVVKNTPELIQITFSNTLQNINTALSYIVPKLEELLQIQNNGYKLQPKLDSLQERFQALSDQTMQKVLIDESAPLFSSQYGDQFSPQLSKKTKDGFKLLALPHNFKWLSYFWMFIFELFVFLGIYLILKKYNTSIQDSTKYKFLANQELPTALFFSTTTMFLLFIDVEIPAIINLTSMVIIGVTFCALVSKVLQSWKKNLVYIFIAIVICTNFLVAINIPVPLFRLYVVLISLAIVILLAYWIRQSVSEKKPKILTYMLSGFALYFGLVLLAEIVGKEVLAMFLFDALIRSIVQIVVYGVYIFIIRGALEWLLIKLTYNREHVNDQDIRTSVDRLSTFISILGAVFILIPQILITWGVFSSMKEANEQLMSFGFTIGSNQITVQIIITALCVLYGSYILSTVVSRFIMGEALNKKDIDKGARLSISQLLHYLIMFIGFMIAITLLGFDLTNFTIILSALGVGIGFGLQGLVNNFVSGLILLFERPIREGDSISAPGTPWSTVNKIGLRATRLTTFEQGDLIVPNSDFTSKNVTNWTLNNRRKNLILPIGVAYGSDIALVIKTLMEAGKANENLVKNSVPTVLFRSFGDSVLNFELRVLAKDANSGLSITSSIYQDIYKRFDKANIQIAYPQLDVHLYNADKSNVAKTEPKATDN